MVISLPFCFAELAVLESLTLPAPVPDPAPVEAGPRQILGERRQHESRFPSTPFNYFQVLKYFLKMWPSPVRVATAVFLALVAHDAGANGAEANQSLNPQASPSLPPQQQDSSDIYTDGNDNADAQNVGGVQTESSDLPKQGEQEPIDNADAATNEILEQHQRVSKLFAETWSRIQLSYMPSTQVVVPPVPAVPSAPAPPPKQPGLGRRNMYIARKRKEVDVVLNLWVQAVETAEKGREEEAPLPESVMERLQNIKRLALHTIREYYSAKAMNVEDMNEQFYKDHPFNPELDPSIPRPRPTPLKSVGPLIRAVQKHAAQEQDVQKQVNAGQATPEDLQRAKNKTGTATRMLNMFASQNLKVCDAHMRVYQEVLHAEGMEKQAIQDFSQKYAEWKDIQRQNENAIQVANKYAAPKWSRPLSSLVESVTSAPGKLRNMFKRMSLSRFDGDAEETEPSPQDLENIGGAQQ